MLANFWENAEGISFHMMIVFRSFQWSLSRGSHQLPSRMCRYDFARAIFSRYSFLVKNVQRFPNSDHYLVIRAAILCNSDGLVSMWSQWRQRRLVLAVSKRLLLSSPLRWLFNMPNGEIWHVVLHEFPCHFFHGLFCSFSCSMFSEWLGWGSKMTTHFVSRPVGICNLVVQWVMIPHFGGWNNVSWRQVRVCETRFFLRCRCRYHFNTFKMFKMFKQCA